MFTPNYKIMSTTRRREHISIQPECDRLRRIYQYDVQMYDIPPAGECSFEEFKESCKERLRVLQLVEQIAGCKKPKTASECRTKLLEKLYEHGLKGFARLIENHGSCDDETILRARQRDHISHFMLKLAFCFERKKWFSRQEVRLFRWRLSSLNKDVLRQLIIDSGLNCILVTKRQLQELRSQLSHCTPQGDVDSQSFYMIPCSLVSNLVSTRKVFLKHGMAYVPQKLMPFVLLAHFKRTLITGFEYARETVCKVKDDDRLVLLFKDMRNCVAKQKLALESIAKVRIDRLDKLSKISYPLCMRQLHEAVRTKHHLQDGGRVQYSLFLKGIGVSWEDALQFWETEFLKIMNEETFHKEYRYYFRHLFGQEGRKANYYPFNCSKIMQSDIGFNDYHGCPFKHLPKAVLKTKLDNYGLHNYDIEQITKFTEERQYSLACKKYFEVTHSCVPEQEITHPNLYFSESRKKADFLHLESSSDEDDEY